MQARLTSTERDLERAATARLLSIGFSPPDESTVVELRCLAAALADGAEAGDPLAGLSAALADVSGAEDLGWEFESLFGGRVACSPYEAGYEPDPFRGTRQIADVAGFYRAFGATSGGPAAERPDHIACQLEFVAFLAARRVAACEGGDEDEATLLAGVEDAFVRSHLGRFMGPFCEAVAEATSSPVFAALAGVGARFIDAELTVRGIDPPPFRRLGPSAVDGDEVTCGVDGGCPLTDIIGRSRSDAEERSG